MWLQVPYKPGLEYYNETRKLYVHVALLVKDIRRTACIQQPSILKLATCTADLIRQSLTIDPIDDVHLIRKVLKFEVADE